MHTYRINKSKLLLANVIILTIFNNDGFCNFVSKNPRSIQNTQLRLPELPKGRALSLRYKSNIDGSQQPMLMKLPENYTPGKKWPLLVTLHGLGDGPILAPNIKSIVQIGPYGRGSLWYTGLGEKDIFECIEFIQKIVSIDEDRIYLSGFSMGGAGTFRLGLKYPHFWAACVPVCGRCDSLYAVENANHVPFWINTGQYDRVLPPEYSKRAYNTAEKSGLSQWCYTEYPEMGHSFSIDWTEIELWLLTHKRTNRPQKVSYRTKVPGRSYWLDIINLEEFGRIAKIDAVVKDQTITINTENVLSYKVRLTECPVDVSQSIRILENGQELFKGFCKNGYFLKEVPNSGIYKNINISGPLWEIYSNSCVLVYGTNTKNQQYIEASKLCAESFANPDWMRKVSFKIIPDNEILKEDIENNNIVLFGNEDTNKVLASIRDSLPLRITGQHVIADGRKYSGENIGFVMIYKNPLNPQKYLAVFAGNSVTSIDCFDKIWPDFHSVPRDIDAGVFEINPRNNAVMWKMKRIFSSNWE